MQLLLIRALALMVALTGVAACSKAKPRVEPARPALVVPEPPPRVVIASPEPAAPTADTDAAGTPITPAARPARRPTRPAVAKPDAPKDDPKPEVPAPKVEETEPPPASPEPAPQLRTPQTADEVQSERRVRETLGKATKALQGVDYSALNPDAKSQYDTAKRFIAQAEQALRTQNYVFASSLADKADTLSQGLLGR